ncbi:uncharacterized protein BYT42DRAFT_466820, partial [Radiomyces spectabilis]|uniref:uncharacterized protein n=1 Tax=Radiomyces spectabilis TaxID=64574 RepID=UPI00221FCEFD
RAPVACYRCHRKKVRCNGTRPMCARCDATNAECTYPTSRRTRSNQPTFVDPFIENISRLEARI